MTMILNWKVSFFLLNIELFFGGFGVFFSSCLCYYTIFDYLRITSFLLPGACGAELACSTCHLIFDQEIFNKLPEMEEEEEDMLDLAFEVTET